MTAENAHPESEQSLTHPEEMLARVRFEVGPISARVAVRVTPVEMVGIALVLLSVAAVVWAARRR